VTSGQQVEFNRCYKLKWPFFLQKNFILKTAGEIHTPARFVTKIAGHAKWSKVYEIFDKDLMIYYMGVAFNKP